MSLEALLAITESLFYDTAITPWCVKALYNITASIKAVAGN
jgi:hypothetical protein